MITTQHGGLLPVPSGDLRVSRLTWNGRHTVGTADQDSSVDSIGFSLIVPTFNEGRNVAKIVSLLCGLLNTALPNDYEVIIVDDDSPDQTWAIAQALMPEFPQLRVMRRQQERGLSTAVIRGWQASRGEIVGVIDGDLQHPPEVLLKMLNAVMDGADLAVASRHVEGGGVSSWSMTRRVLSRGAQLLGLVLCPAVVGRVSDPMSGYFMVRRAAIADCLLNPLGYKILLEVLGRGQINRIAEVGYVFQEREAGESKVTSKLYTQYIQHLIQLRLSSGRLGRLKRRLEFPVSRFLRFGAVGLSGLVVDMAVLYLLHDWAGFNLTRSAILAAELAIVNNFIWNDFWTFRDLAKGQSQLKQRVKRFLKFNIVCLMGLVLKVLLLNLLFNVFGVNPYLANFLAIAAVTFWNFWINLKLSWRVTQSK
jgi:dolichol-phosphate mannosyltransferase